MGAIETCRTAALGGHVARCGDCGHMAISYNSCGNRHCPKCQAGAAREWLEARAADLLPVEYFHVVFTLPAPVAAIAFQNKAVVYAFLFEAAVETLKMIAGDPKHLGAGIGATMVLHTWGQTLTHHPHVHCIVPGGGLSPDGKRWIACRPGFFLPVRVLSRLYRRLFLDKLGAAHRAGELKFFNDLATLSDPKAFAATLAPLRRSEWVVYAKRPFAGPGQVLAYLSRYTHRIAISNRRLLAFDEAGVTFRYKDYRRSGADRQQVMTLAADESNRIIAVSRPAATLLGYDDPWDLVGLRLLALIPERYHQAHVAGFTLMQLTGRSPLLGTEVQVPARRADGSEAPVCLLIRVERGEDGLSVFIAEIEAADG